jgi:hypothetical protein
VSSKSCKGIYKSLLNGALQRLLYHRGRSNLPGRPRRPARHCASGVHGLTHAERNGHHYVNGFANTPEPEAQAFLTAHPDLYEENRSKVRLSIRDGAISTRSLAAPGFASGLRPDQINPRANQEQPGNRVRDVSASS